VTKVLNTAWGRTFESRAKVRSLSDVQELLLASAALIVGLVYVCGPEQWQTSGTFAAFHAIPGRVDAFGWINFTLFAALLYGRFFATPGPLRYAHSVGAGVYFLYSFLIGLSIYPLGTAQAGAGWLFAGLTAFMHYRSAQEVNGKVVQLRENSGM
jgi:hypothetical protein